MLIYYCVYDKEKQPGILDVMSPNGNLFKLYSVELAKCLQESGGDMQFLCLRKGDKGRAFVSTIRSDGIEFCVDNGRELVPLTDLREIYAIADRWDSFKYLSNQEENNATRS